MASLSQPKVSHGIFGMSLVGTKEIKQNEMNSSDRNSKSPPESKYCCCKTPGSSLLHPQFTLLESIDPSMKHEHDESQHLTP